jgi:hypothetical protein
MYACVVKNNEGTWDIYRVTDHYSIPEQRRSIFTNAVASGLPITGMNLTQYKDAAVTGATWNGETFVGGLTVTFPDDFAWDTVEIYGYVCDDTIIYPMLCFQANHKAQYSAIFDSETTIVDIPDDQAFKIGDIWDGEKVINSNN